MRLWAALACSAGMALAGCAGPHSTGALWAQQNLDQELAQFRVTETQRRERAHAYELQLADEALAAERSRLATALQDCPGTVREALAVSPGDRLRDSIRVWADRDAAVSVAVAQVAWSDWLVRRGRSTGETRFCDAARSALNGSVPRSENSSEDPLGRAAFATVAREPRATTQAPLDSAPLVALSLYASGWADVVHAASPLPQYLAAVYGGVVVEAPTLEASPRDESPATIVDRIGPNHPDWEPDALYAALTSSATP